MPLKNTLPYEKILDDFFIDACPFCNNENVLLPIKRKDAIEIQSGVKKMIVLPCCHQTVKVIDIDVDYLYMDRKVR